MKRVRVLLVFEEVDEQGEIVHSARPGNFKFGSVTNEHYGPPEVIASKVGDLVSNTIRTHFPEFLKGVEL